MTRGRPRPPGWTGSGAGARLRAASDALLQWPPYFRARFWTRAPSALERRPEGLWPGDPARGQDMLRGRFALGGQDVAATVMLGGGADAAPARPEWFPATAGRGWLAAWHGFDWLDDLRAVGGGDQAEARRLARAVVGDWIESFGQRWDRFAWAPGVSGRRLAAWLRHADYLCADAGGDDGLAAGPLHRQIARHARYLSRMLARRDFDGAERIAALKGLYLATLSLPGARKRLRRLAVLLDAALERQVLADGGHFSRSPEVHLAVLRDLIEIADALSAAKQEYPNRLQGGIDRMAPMLRLFRHRDGGLCLFNDSVEGAREEIDAVLARADVRGKAMPSAPHSGFERLANRRTVVLMDVGAPPPRASGVQAHAGALSFEMSAGRDRLIVNCGAWRGRPGQWDDVAQASAAHSTLVVEDTSSLRFAADGEVKRAPRAVTATRREIDGAVWVDAEHDGYRTPFNLTHHRRLYLGVDGEDLRGEDRLIPGAGGPREARRFAVRFHLHPSVGASLIQGGAAVLLRPPSGAGWYFRADGGTVELAESIYMGRAGEVKRAEQIVVTGRIGRDEVRVRWALQKVSSRGSGGDDATGDEAPPSADAQPALIDEPSLLDAIAASEDKDG